LDKKGKAISHHYGFNMPGIRFFLPVQKGTLSAEITRFCQNMQQFQQNNEVQRKIT
jgi:hypothetical protein